MLAIVFTIKVWCQFHPHSSALQHVTINCRGFSLCASSDRCLYDRLACRAGEIFSCEHSHRKKFCRHLKFLGSGRPERERKFYRGGERQARGRIGEEVGRRKSRLPEVIVLLGNSVRPQTEFLIGAARPYLSIVCQSLFKLFVSCGKETRQTLSKVVLLAPLSRNLNFLCELRILALGKAY